MHIGLIGGIGPAATAFYYERIVSAFTAATQDLNLTIAHTSARDLSRNVAENRVAEQVNEYTRVTGNLQRAGAQVIVITSMGGHFCAKEFSAECPLPLIDGPDSVAAYLKKEGIKKIGILGTRIVMKSRLYGTLSGKQAVVPEEDDLAKVNEDYVAVAIAGKATSEQRERLLKAGRNLIQKQGADAVLLGGTDLNLVYSESVFEYPVVDSAVVHVDAVVSHVLQNS